ncbi:DUF4136 domain-containing protein [Rugamonas apoptosis]|uniref:DUF4136 domain-containing protein n=1 Tax=Rugamonas apoptosis TaxID=2758570 RepID=A0A7W2IKW2_9BURK|nr:DUF4136 domain-containing protein [Rugamonas apoptosis]MBA5687949.1 DUF4136 domain-containing protein [Rugamonas apoptosis]
MKSFAIVAAAATLLLSGCATTIRSDVTAFNDWPADLHNKAYVFSAPPPNEDTLEYRSYQVLVSNELGKLGFKQAADGVHAGLLVGMRFKTVDQPIRVLMATDPFWPGPYWGPGWGRYPYHRYGYRPFFYDPMFYGPMEVEEGVRHQYERQLNITINSDTGRKLYDVTVHNVSRVQATPHVMPALVQSAFTGFPGQSGVPHQVELKIDAKMLEDEAPAVPAAAQKEAPPAVK